MDPTHRYPLATLDEALVLSDSQSSDVSMISGILKLEDVCSQWCPVSSMSEQ